MFFAPLPLASPREAFAHLEFVFELKWDGRRCIPRQSCRVVLYSRYGNVYKRFDHLTADLQQSVRSECVLEGGDRVPGLTVRTRLCAAQTWKGFP